MIVSNGVSIPDLQEEARIPLNKDWNGYEILYLVENSPKRMCPKEILQREDELIEYVIQNTSVDNDPRRIEEGGYRVDILDSASEEDLKQILELYQETFTKYLFPMTLENVRKLITNTNARASVVRDSDGKIVSICVAETARIDTNLGSLYICELSDEATHPEHRRRGLNSACIQRLIEHLYEKDGIDLIFEEARAPHIGVNKVAAKLGFKYVGRLNKHCVIGGSKEIYENNSYENLNVWYLPRCFNEIFKGNTRKK